MHSDEHAKSFTGKLPAALDVTGRTELEDLPDDLAADIRRAIEEIAATVRDWHEELTALQNRANKPAEEV